MISNATDPMDLQLDAAAFAARMALFAPFEQRPLLAVAVSGGRDSLCLALLASQWASERGGRIIALTVDHGLRAEARAEAEQVETWLAERAIETRILTWRTLAPPVTAIQATARAARYRLLSDCCAGLGILHLLVAHQADDQAETFVQRLLRDSGIEGLAGMAACVELPALRLLRPLLDVPRSVVTSALQGFAQDWIDDPSNRSEAYERGRLRAAGLPIAAEQARLASAALGRLRGTLEERVNRLLAEIADVHPLGAVTLEPVLSKLPARLAMAIVSRAVVTAGGRNYPPRSARLRRLVAGMRQKEASDAGYASRDATLAGCRILWRQHRWVVCRDPAAIRTPQVSDETGQSWDGRFQLPTSVRAAPFGLAGWARHRESLMERYPGPGLAVIAQGLPGPAVAPVAGDASEKDLTLPPFKPVRPLVPAPFFPCFADATRQMLV